MVSRACLAALAGLATAGPVSGQPALDWGRAGGALFVEANPAPPRHATGPAPSAPSPDAALSPAAAGPVGAGAEPARLAPLSQPFMAAIAAAAARHGLDPKLLHALVLVESAYRPTACSPAGACGLTQLMPATAVELGVADRFDPVANLGGGADYLARQMLRFGDLRLALAAYNSGPGRVARLGRVPDIPETRAYVTRVIDCYLAFSAGRSVRSSRQCPSQGGGR